MASSNIRAQYTIDRYFRHTMVLLGEPGVGKSSLVTRYMTGAFNQQQEPTIGASFLTKMVHGGKLDIWDLSGTENVHAFAPLLLRSPQTAVIVYDVTNKDSFDKIKTWIAQIAALGSSAIVLVGNKSDLSVDRSVAVENGIRFAEEHHLMFVETSAKTRHNLDILFDVIIVDRLRRTERPPGDDEDFVFLADDVIDLPSCVVKRSLINNFSAEFSGHVQAMITRFNLFTRKSITPK